MAQNVPGTDRPAEKAAGHWLLAQLGKKVLRPGGRETTEFLLRRVLGGEIDVVEFAPGLGITALEIVKRQPATYTGVDLDPKAAEIVRERIDAANHPNYRVVNASAEETGLPSESFDVVVGEAMLTMQTDHHKLDIMKEAARELKRTVFLCQYCVPTVLIRYFNTFVICWIQHIHIGNTFPLAVSDMSLYTDTLRECIRTKHHHYQKKDSY